MHNHHRFLETRKNSAGLRWLVVLGLIALSAWLLAAQMTRAAAAAEADSLLTRYRRVEVASVSDALEQLMGKSMYMSHRMQPIFTTRFAGYARTVQLKKDEGHNSGRAERDAHCD